MERLTNKFDQENKDSTKLKAGCTLLVVIRKNIVFKEVSYMKKIKKLNIELLKSRKLNY